MTPAELAVALEVIRQSPSLAGLRLERERTLDELVADHIAKLRRINVESRARDYAGGW